MSNIVSLDAAAAAREERREAMRAVHPLLRFVAGRTFYVSHRKSGTSAACGAVGDLTLAPPGVPQCVVCWPPEERDLA